MAESKQYNSLNLFTQQKAGQPITSLDFGPVMSHTAHAVHLTLHNQNTIQKREVLQLNFKERTMIGLLCFIQIRLGPSIQQSWITSQMCSSQATEGRGITKSVSLTEHCKQMKTLTLAIVVPLPPSGFTASISLMETFYLWRIFSAPLAL